MTNAPAPRTPKDQSTVRLKLALVLLKKRRAWYEAYEADVSTWYRSGGGRDGYRYPVCIHGTDLTTDYDNICQGCEDGYNYFDYLRAVEDSIADAKMYFNMADERREAVATVSRLRGPISDELISWAMEPVTQHYKKG